MARKPSLTARMADLLDRIAFGLEATTSQLPHTPRSSGQPTYPLSTRESFLPSAQRLAEQARALADEYRRRRCS